MKHTNKELWDYAFVLADYSRQIIRKYPLMKLSGFDTLLTPVTAREAGVVTTQQDTAYFTGMYDLRQGAIEIHIKSNDKPLSERFVNSQFIDSRQFNYGYDFHKDGGYIVALKGEEVTNNPKGLPVYYSESLLGIVFIRSQILNDEDQKFAIDLKNSVTIALVSGEEYEPEQITVPDYSNFAAEALLANKLLIKRDDEQSYIEGLEELVASNTDEELVKMGNDFFDVQGKDMMAAGAELSDKYFGSREELTESGFVHDYWGRALVSRMGTLGNTHKISQYTAILRDSDDAQMDGSNGNVYELSFPADVPVEAFWSLTMYEAKDRMMYINKENISSYRKQNSKVVDGTITITIAHEDNSYENYLPAPEGQIYMVFRWYMPKWKIMSNKDKWWFEVKKVK